MSFRESQTEFRNRHLLAYSTEEAVKYDGWIATLSLDDHNATLLDMIQHCELLPGMSVLDAGAGTGALCLTLSLVPSLQVTALEPCPAMVERFQQKPQLADVRICQGFCDHISDRSHFQADAFDVIVSRQLTNNLFDPLAAFGNWYHWLRPKGLVVVMDGLYDRGAWGGQWESYVDRLPLSACRTMATVPYLLECSGFDIEFVGFMDKTNALKSTITKRYMVVAKKKS
jgi:SAM-dependent methyltransferase